MSPVPLDSVRLRLLPLALSRVFEKVMAPLVAPSVALAPRVTASPNTMPAEPLVAIKPPLRAVVPPASVVSETSAELLPTVPEKVVAPAVFTTKAEPPLTVLPKAIAPLAELETIVLAPNVAAPEYV